MYSSEYDVMTEKLAKELMIQGCTILVISTQGATRHSNGPWIKFMCKQIDGTFWGHEYGRASSPVFTKPLPEFVQRGGSPMSGWWGFFSACSRHSAYPETVDRRNKYLVSSSNDFICTSKENLKIK